MKPNVGQGDKGITSLFGGKKIDKDDCQIESCGDVDELNSYIGLIRTCDKELDGLLEKVQEDLFVIGSNLTLTSENSSIPHLAKENVGFIEENILKFEKDLPELHKFILPTSNMTGALLHVARAVCRRAERSIVTLSKEKKLDESIVPYINRLSDLLFILARYANKKEGKAEKEWITRP